MLSVEKKMYKGASWLALFKLVSQVLSWMITILVARILSPGDYGLMEMSTILTGYAMIFSELGLGSAIIQRQGITSREMSSIFWFMLAFSSFMAVLCLVLAYPTAAIFNDHRVIPLTQAVSVLFILTGLQIVPSSMLRKELEFKTIGMIEMTGTVVSSICMYAFACLGAGVWTLLGGHIIRELVKLVMMYLKAGWLPSGSFSFQEVKSYLGFGINVAMGRTLHYVYDKSDKFFAGRAWPVHMLGYYSFALQLAKIPTDKIVSLINQASYPAFAQLQASRDEFNRFYLRISKVTMVIVLPIFVGGFMVGDELVRLLLDEKWLPIIPLFRYLCLAQLIVSLITINNLAHVAQGRPHWSLAFNAVVTVFMPISFYFATRHGLNAILIPWFTTYLVLCTGWTLVTLKKIGIGPGTYLGNLFKPAAAVVTMSLGILAFQTLAEKAPRIDPGILVTLAIEVAIGALLYAGFLWVFDRGMVLELKKLRSDEKMREAA